MPRVPPPRCVVGAPVVGGLNRIGVSAKTAVDKKKLDSKSIILDMAFLSVRIE